MRSKNCDTIFIDYGDLGSKNILSRYIKSDKEFIYMKYLEWDTKFFGKDSYNLDVKKSNFKVSKNMIESLKNNFLNSFITVKLDTNYDYAYSDFLQKCDFRYIDTEVELVYKNQIDIDLNDEINIVKLNKNINLPYKELGSSFSLTRFHTDLNISNKKADKLWIEYLKNFKPNNEKILYIAKIKNEIVGVVLVNIAENIVNIFYIAVLEKFRSFGVGKVMIQEIIKKYKNFIIKTETQVKNINALNFYIKNGFMIENTKSVFHRWG